MENKDLLDGITIVEKFDDIESYQKDAFNNKIAIQAARAEREKNKKLGIPSAFMQNGEIHYELADGTITKEKPWK